MAISTRAVRAGVRLACGALLAAVVGCYAAHGAVVYEPSGDELYDAYAQLLLAEMEQADWNAAPRCWLTEESYGTVSWLPEPSSRLWGAGEHATQQPRRIDCREILAWEERFSEDPRYWQLRRLCVFAAYSDASQVLKQADLARLDSLCRAGRGDEGALALRFESAPGLADETSGQLAEDIQLAVCAQAVELYPDNSYWHYRKALVLIGLGEPEAAWASLRAGHAAPRNAWAQPFPYSTLFDPRYSVGQAEGNRIVRGVIYTQLSSDLPNFIRIKEAYKETCVMLALGYDPAFADDMLRMAGRMGQMQQVTSVHQTVAAVLPTVLGEYVSTELLNEPESMDAELQELVTLSTDFKALAGELAPNYPPSDRAGQTPQTPFQQALKRGDAAFSALKPATDPLGGIYTDMPALQKADWLFYDDDFQIGQAQLARHARFFDQLANPPLARLFAQAASQPAR